MEAGAMKSTKALEGARRRNSVYQRHLDTQIDNIEAEYRIRNGKIISETNEVKNHLLQIKPLPERNAVCPSGLSHTEKQEYQKIRRITPPSISIEELDKRLGELKTTARRKLSDITQYKSTPTVTIDELEKPLNELKTTVRRRISDGNQEYKKQINDTPNEGDSTKFNTRDDFTRSSIPIRKLRMKEALKRYETNDMKIRTEYKNCGKQDSKTPVRRKSSSDIPRDFHGD